MSGKAYTMKELKGIVEYLIDHKAYGETKARKMWTVYASSGLTNRTWQSLKETFLKRILPDLHNPYYKLSMDEIRSFSTGVDHTSKINNKLEIQTLTSNSGTNGPKDNEQPSTSNNKTGAEDLSGEDNKCSNVSSSRDSVDTVMINTEDCYTDAQDLIKDLLNDSCTHESDDSTKPSIRDCIVYSEPLTPLLQEIIHDFQSEDSDSEPQMVIDDCPNTQQEIRNIASSAELTQVNDENDANTTDKGEKNLIAGEKQNHEDKDSHRKALHMKKNVSKNVSQKRKRSSSEGSRKQSEKKVKNKQVNKSPNTENTTEVFETSTSAKGSQNSSTFDSLLPNNQEELHKKQESQVSQLETTNEKNKKIKKAIKVTTTDKIKKAKPKNKRKKILSISESTSNEEVAKDILTKGSDINASHIENTSTSSKKEENQSNRIEGINQEVNEEQNSDKIETNNTQESAQSINPCLQSVSLYAEQQVADLNDSDHSAKSTNKGIEVNGGKSVNTNKNRKLNANKATKEKVSLQEESQTIKTVRLSKGNKLLSDSDSADANVIDNSRPINTSTETNYSNKENTHSNPRSNPKKEAKNKEQKPDAAKNSQESVHSNPCLQSVSLFEEQFVTTQLSDSDLSNELNGPDNSTSNKNFRNEKSAQLMTQSEVVVLKSHTDSESDNEVQPIKAKSIIPHNLKKKVLTNLFGSSSGLSRKRPGKYTFRNGSVNRRPKPSSSESSEWTSDSDGEYVSPPRSRNRHSRKYLKPQSSRILSLEQDGNLFVACGKKVYPLIKDGKTLKNYLTYLPESDSEDESYWKVKYVEERKRTAELTSLLENINKGPVKPNRNICDSPILQSKPSKTTNDLPTSPRKSCENNVGELALQKQMAPKVEEKTVKIKFAKDNEEVFLEGHWQDIHPILSEVMHVFQKDGSTKPENIRLPTPPVEIHSGKSTPIVTQPLDEETRKKVDDMESRIFQEIEDIDMDNKTVHEQQPTIERVTERRKRGQPKKYSPTPVKNSPTSRKRPKSPSRSDTEIIVNEDKLKPIDDKTNRSARSSNEKLPNIDKTNDEMVTEELQSNNNFDKDEEQILYKFPSPEPEKRNPKRSLKKNKVRSNNNKNKTLKRYSCDSLILHSDSSQGYQNSDNSPIYNIRRKRMTSLPTYSCRSKSYWGRARRNSNYFAWENDDEGISSSFKAKSRSVSMQNLTLNSEVYRSDSYQLLMPRTRNFRPMERISEVSPCSNDVDSACDLMLSPASQVVEERSNESGSLSVNNREAGNSSNVSLPLSPELSIVENISIDKNMLNNADFPTSNVECDEQYLISKVDVSVPLMSQECYLKTSIVKQEVNPCSQSESVNVTNTTPPEVPSIEIMDIDSLEDNCTVSDSLDMRLQNMLLESAKKMSAQNKKNDICSNLDVDEKPLKKRCSTPRKRPSKKLQLQPVESTISECMEYCKSGRKSCPPVISSVSDEVPEPVIAIETNITNITKRKARNKNNIIKVKIVRPKKKTKSIKTSKKATKEMSRISLLTDSGINDTISSTILHDIEEDVNLIHNHSETCLHTNECLNKSVELIETSNSIIYLNSSSLQSIENKENLEIKDDFSNGLTPDMFFTDALDGISLNTNESVNLFNGPNNSGGASSLITEDLSDETTLQPRSSKWYLLSDEETTNTLVDVLKPAECSLKSSYGSNLKQLFPIVCTVPDLSTITEMSRENDSNSRKGYQQNTDSNTRNDLLKEFKDNVA